MTEERYLTAKECRTIMKVGKSTFYRWLPKLKALGLREIRSVNGSSTVRFLESTLHEALARAAERETPLETAP